jgi:hypothetical protein
MVLIRPIILFGSGSFALGWIGALVIMMQWIVAPRWVLFGFILLTVASAVALIVGFNRYAKCPACGKFPRARNNKVALNVESCSNCGEQLK